MIERFNGPYKMVSAQDWDCNQGEMALLEVKTKAETIPELWFVCPCGCGNNTALAVNGHKNEIGATWRFSENKDLPTISPSIHSFKTCGAHYFIENGMVRWC